MFKPFPMRLLTRRAAVAVMVAIALVPLLVVLAIALDGGLFYAEKRHAQATADAAALAGATDLFKNYSTNKGKDPNGTAEASALSIAAANGYTDGVSTVEVGTAGEIYLGGPDVGKTIRAGYIEVTVTYHHPRYFSLILGTTPIPIKARAVAMGVWGPYLPPSVSDPMSPISILALATTGTGLTVNGNGLIDTGGTVMVNSSDPDAAVKVAGNSTLKAEELNSLGGLSGGGEIITSPTPDNVQQGVPAVPDPLAALPPPSAPAPGAITKVKNSDVLKMLSDLHDKKVIDDAYYSTHNTKQTQPNVYVMTPGSYDKISNFNQNDLIVFKQASANNSGGIYYLNSGGFDSTGAGLVMDPDTSGGMMFYNNGTTQTDKINIRGTPGNPVSLSGLATGTYQGLMIYQNRDSTQPVKLEGNGLFTTDGTIYAPSADLSITGNGTATFSMVIGKTVTIGGNGELTVTLNNGGGEQQPPPPPLWNARFIRLVE